MVYLKGTLHTRHGTTPSMPAYFYCIYDLKHEHAFMHNAHDNYESRIIAKKEENMKQRYERRKGKTSTRRLCKAF